MSDRVFIPDPHIAWPPAHNPASAVVFAQNAIDIAASPEKVWPLVVNCVAWPERYRHCSDVSVVRGGPILELGSIFRFKTLRSWFEPEVIRCDRHGMLVWSAKGPAGTSGSHDWYIEPTPTGCRVVTEEVQTGLLLRLVRKRLRAELLACHEDWVRGLKALAEAAEAS